MARLPESAQPDETAVRPQLERILASPVFSRSKRMQDFLRFVVDEALAGRGAALKAYTIGLEVFGREPSEVSDGEALVRVEARRLRQKLKQYYEGDGAADPVLVELPKGGYLPQFSHREAAAPEAGSPEPAPDEGPEPDTAERPWARTPWPARRTWGLAAGLLAVVALGLGVGLWQPWRGTVRFAELAPAAGGEPLARIGEIAPGLPSIAVMPFEDLTESEGQLSPGRGLSDGIIGGLMRYPRLLVVAWDTVEHYREEALEIEDLGVRFVLDGSVREVEGVMRVSAQLTDVATHTAVWAGSFDRAVTARDQLAVEDEIAKLIIAYVAKSFEMELDPTVLAQSDSHEESVESYECLLRARAYARDVSPQEHAQMRDCLEQAVIRDPEFGKAWAALAFAYIDEARYGFNARPERYDALQQAATVAERAEALAPRSAMAYRALFTVHFMLGNLEAFRAAGERALALNPNNSEVLADFGLKLAFTGEWDEGLALLDRAVALNPAHPHWYRFPRVYNYYRQGLYEEALKEALQIDMPNYPPTHFALAVVYGELGRSEEAAAELERLIALFPDFALRPRHYLGQWQFPDELVDHFIEGLAKAGMALPPNA